jgi:molybdate transport system permease protein
MEGDPVKRRTLADLPFLGGLWFLAGVYAALIVAMLVATSGHTSWSAFTTALSSPTIRHSVLLSLLTTSIATILAIWVAIPAGYLLARTEFPGKRILDIIFDIPIVLPPLVVGLALLILFQTTFGQWFQEHIMRVTYEVPAIILAQFTVAAAFAIRTMRVAFEQSDPRTEDVARVLGASRFQAFLAVTLPDNRHGILAAATLAWARALGEFGPILVFAGATRMKTEVLPTTVFLELSIGDLEAAVAVSLLLVLFACIVLLGSRALGLRGGFA